MNSELEKLKKFEKDALKYLKRAEKRDRIIDFFCEDRSWLLSYHHGRSSNHSILSLISLMLIFGFGAFSFYWAIYNPWLCLIGVGGIGLGLFLGLGLPNILEDLQSESALINIKLEQVRTKIEALEKGVTVEEILKQREEEKERQRILKELKEEGEKLNKKKNLIVETKNRLTLKEKTEELIDNLAEKDAEKAEELRKELEKVEELKSSINSML